MFKSPNRIKVMVEKPSPDDAYLISRFLNEDWAPAEASAVSLPVVKKKSASQVRSAEQRQKEVKGRQVQYLEGECYLPEKIEMRVLTRSVVLPCVFGDRTGKVEAVLSADPKTGALLAVPKKVKIGSRYYEVVRGVITTSDGSLNIADEVNRQYLKRVLASGAIAGFQAGFEAYREYAQNKNTKTYTVDGGTVVQEKSIPASYPLISAVLGAVSGMAKAVQNIMQREFQKIPVIYVVKPKSLLFRGEVK